MRYEILTAVLTFCVLFTLCIFWFKLGIGDYDKILSSGDPKSMVYKLVDWLQVIKPPSLWSEAYGNIVFDITYAQAVASAV